MRIVTFEHLAGGGMIGRNLPDDMLRQGLAMLLAVSEDLIAAGHEVTTILDSRVSDEPVGARIVRVEDDEDVAAVLRRTLRDTDAALVIAPECEGLNEHWSRIVREADVRTLGCDVEAIALCSDKFALAQQGVRVPATQVFDGRRPAGSFVLKPRFGAGCEHTYHDHLHEAAHRDPQQWIVQRFVPGEAMSVSFIVHDSRGPRALRAGRQLIRSNDGQLSYHGGTMPVNDRSAQAVIFAAEHALRTIPGLRGFVGVDLIWNSETAQATIIEINPRLTMSYVGLRALCAGNLAAAMLDSSAAINWRDGQVRFDASGKITWEQSS